MPRTKGAKQRTPRELEQEARHLRREAHLLRLLDKERAKNSKRK